MQGAALLIVRYRLCVPNQRQQQPAALLSGEAVSSFA